tara:strand:- start:2017 stop:3444 length:1428 start_codon:yes stop_codon:yes gene_type:complete
MASIKRNYGGSSMIMGRRGLGGRGARFNRAVPNRSVSARPRPRPNRTSPMQAETAQDIANQARIRNIEIERRARQIANQLIAQRERARLAARNGRIFTEFDLDTDVIPNQQEIVTKGLFPNNTGNQTRFFTSSLLTATQKRYYQEVFNGEMTNTGNSANDVTASSMFSIAYGHVGGSGSADEGGQVNDTPSRAIYSQYRLLCLEPDDKKFTINGVDQDSMYFININRALMKERLDEGNIELNLAYLSGSKFSGPNSDNTSSAEGIRALSDGTTEFTGQTNPVLRIVDDSKITSAISVRRGHFGRRYNLVSGSIEQGVYNSTNPYHVGLLYPDLGVMALSADVLNVTGGFNTATGSEINGNNALKLFTSISHSGAFLLDASNDKLGFQARSSEKVTSTHYFVRATNAEYNFSNNPTFVTGSNGRFAQSSFIGDPKVYITTIGLYNDRRELLAVAKLSKPLLKSFTREALIKVKLDF